jgi:hypothetical protein
MTDPRDPVSDRAMARELLAKILVNMGANAIRPEEDRVDLLAMLTAALREERERALEEAVEAVRAVGCDLLDSPCRTCAAIDRLRALKGQGREP